MNWRDTVLRMMRVPPTPAPPPGSPPKTFRAAPNFFLLGLIRWLLTQVLAVAGLIWAIYFVSWIASTKTPKIVIWFLQASEIFAWTVFIGEVVFGWMIVRLDYEMRWYMLSDRAIRIREGIATVREKTIALANIQNIAIRQGPLQRFLGIADVEVKTAGGGGGSSSELEGGKKSGEPMHVGYFRGVANAEEIRDLLREGVRRQRDAGLGDPDEAHSDIDEVVAELLTEARALRNTITTFLLATAFFLGACASTPKPTSELFDLDGTWRGQVKGFRAPAFGERTYDYDLWVTIEGNRADLWYFDEGKWNRLWDGAKRFSVARHESNAVLSGIHSNPKRECHWVETWSLTVSQYRPGVLETLFYRIVNNTKCPEPEYEGTQWAIGATGTLERLSRTATKPAGTKP